MRDGVEAVKSGAVAVADRRLLGTGCGFVSIAIWGMTIPLMKLVSEDIGAWWTGAFACMLAGGLGVLPQLNGKGMRKLSKLPRGYVFWSGAVFVAYILTFYLGVGWSLTRQQAVEVGMVNYLWPCMTIVCSLLFFKYRAGMLLWVGTVLALVGVGVLMSGNEDFKWSMVWGNMMGDGLVYALTFVAAVTFAVYSNMTKKWFADHDVNLASWFLGVGGLSLLVGGFAQRHEMNWGVDTVVCLLGLGLLVHLVAYSCWEYSMRKGDITLVAAGSYGIPALSVMFGVLFLGVEAGWMLVAGTVAVVVGAGLCKLGVKEEIEEVGVVVNGEADVSRSEEGMEVLGK
ncbi:aromatic amino acid DMT transporter YddG [Planctomycetota bacterium]|nr:aromatic amino acid DMT transporter YddG [Planctomycetota bacterium]